MVPNPRASLFPDYTVRPVVPAEKAELISVAKAMHRENFGKNIKALFHLEKEAALKSIQTGVGGTRAGREVRQVNFLEVGRAPSPAWLMPGSVGAGVLGVAGEREMQSRANQVKN